MSSSPPEVVITGAGVVSPIGIGIEAVRASLATGQSGVRRLSVFDTPEFPVRIGSEVVDFDPRKFGAPRKSLKVMSRCIQFAFASADMAVKQAGLATSGVEPERLGVVFGADMIQIEPDELVDAFRSCVSDGKFDYQHWNEQAIGEMFPLWMLKYLPNMPACHVAITHDARGPNNTIVLAEASSLLAIAEGARVIERSGADVMIVGGTGSRIHPLIWAFRDNANLHSPRTEQPAEVSRPFDVRRDGMVYGEGAAAFVLETRQHAVARGAKILATIRGSANHVEPCAPGKPVTGRAIRASIQQSLANAKISASELGHVNAHGLSTKSQDQSEAQAIHDTLGDVPVTALKSYFGNLGGGSGAVEMIGSLLAFETGQIPRTLNYEQADPACPVNVVAGRAEGNGAAGAGTHVAPPKPALLLNQTLMGQSAALVLAPG